MNVPRINEALKLVRLYWGKTQVDLARLLGISQSYLSEVEKGKREVTLDLLGRYSSALNVPMSTLLFFAESIEGAAPVSRGRFLMAGKALKLLKRLVPDEIQASD